MNQTKEVLTKIYNLSYDSEMGVLFHWSRHRGWVPLARNKTKKGAYYVFKHEGRPTYVNEKVVLEAFADKDIPLKRTVKYHCKVGSRKLNVRDYLEEDEILEEEK